MKSEEKKCGESCGCNTQVEVKKDEQKILNNKSLEKKEEKKLDPTHFGDWQVGCRTIDF